MQQMDCINQQACERGLTKRSQAERLVIADSLIASVWKEYLNGSIDRSNLQLAAYIQTNVNRIVWKLNELNNPNTPNTLKALDCISRQEAIDGKISIQRSNGLEVYSDEAVPVEYLKSLPSAQPEQRWIPCSERLPKLGIRYNVTYESGEVGYADFRNKVIYGDKCIENVWDIPEYYEDDGQVVAWMPMPEPWREENR